MPEERWSSSSSQTLFHPNLVPFNQVSLVSSASWFQVPSDNQVVESQVLFNHQILLPEEGRRELDSGQDFSLIRGNGVVLFRLTTIVIRVDK